MTEQEQVDREFLDLLIDMPSEKILECRRFLLSLSDHAQESHEDLQPPSCDVLTAMPRK